MKKCHYCKKEVDSTYGEHFVTITVSVVGTSQGHSETYENGRLYICMSCLDNTSLDNYIDVLRNNKGLA